MARKKAKDLPPKMITVYGEILQETDDAILVRCGEDADHDPVVPPVAAEQGQGAEVAQ